MSEYYKIKIDETEEKTITSEEKEYTNINYENGAKILSFSMTKKMYAPCRLNVTLSLKKDTAEDEKANIMNAVKNRASVTFYVVWVDNGNSQDKILAENYCLFGYKFCEKKEGTNTQSEVTLYIYSKDHYLTLDKGCMAYTGRCFVGDIFPKNENKKNNDTNNDKSNKKIGLGNIKGLQDYYSDFATKVNVGVKENLNGKLDGKRLPYLVQYNESFYDFICRTANKYGEFLFFEDGKLNLGLLSDSTDDKTITPLEVIFHAEPVVFDSTTDLRSHDTALNMASYLKEVKYTNSELHEKLRKKEKEVATFYTPVLSTGITLTPNLWVEGIPKAGALAGKIYLDEKANDDEKWKLHKKNNLENYTANDDIKKIYYDDGGGNVFEFSDISDDSQNYWDIGEYINKKDNEYHFLEIKIEEDKVYDECPKLGQKIKYDGQDYAVVQVDLTYPADGHPCVFKAIKPIDGIYYPAPLSDNNIRVSKPQIGIVSRRDDPLFLGRVRIRFKWQGKNLGDDSPWIHVASPLESMYGGVRFRPEVDDEVLVDFEKGNVEKPFVSGYLFTTNHHDNAKYIPTRGIVSRNGHSISFIDKPGLLPWLSTIFPVAGMVNGKGVDFSISDVGWGNHAGGIIIKDRYDFYRIETSSEKRRIDFISAFGGIGVNAFTGITINSPNGDVNITGKNVSITAGNNLNIVSGTNAYAAVRPYGWETMGWCAFLFKVVVATALNKGITLLGIDMSLYRSIFDIIFRPMQGDLRLKSYRNVCFGAGLNTPNLLDDPNSYYFAIWYTDFCKEIATNLRKKKEKAKDDGDLKRKELEKWNKESQETANSCPDEGLGGMLASMINNRVEDNVDVIDAGVDFGKFNINPLAKILKLPVDYVRKQPFNETWGNIYFADGDTWIPLSKSPQALKLDSADTIKANFNIFLEGLMTDWNN